MEQIIQLTYNHIVFYINIKEKRFVYLQENVHEKSLEEIKHMIYRTGKSFPYLLFVGNEIVPQINEFNTVHLMPIKKRSIEFFYRLKNDEKRYRLVISVKFILDVYPVYVHFISNLKSEIQLLQNQFKNQFDMIIYSSSLTRLDILNLRILFPKAKYVLAGSYTPDLEKQENWENYRITDIASKVGEDYITKNPVYASRLYLRKLDFDKMYQLPFTFRLTIEEFNIIISFLNIMLENKNKSKELILNKEKIEYLKLYYEFLLNLHDKNFSKLEEYLEKDLLKDKNLKRNIFLYLKRFRESKIYDLTKDEEIRIWQIETLLDFQTKEETV